MKLKKLFKDIAGIQIKGPKNLEISGISSHSKLVAPGNLFIAKKGLSNDGSRYISEAIAGGAAAILTDMYDPSRKEVVQIIHSNVAGIEGALAAQFYQYPSEQLFMTGITGTNGKTTTSFLIKFLIDSLEGPCGLIGTIEYIIGSHRYQATRTTPDVVTNHKMLREMGLQNCRSAVMEVTSHALDQGRVDQIHFDVAVFTNLTLDHLDYHETMEAYCEAKAQLFKNLHLTTKTKNGLPKAVVNCDSPWTACILRDCKVQILTYGIEGHADLKASNIRMSPKGAEYDIHYGEKFYRCASPLVGRHNIYNALAAVAVCLVKGYTLSQIIPLIAKLPAVPARMEPVKNVLGRQIYVDFAHSGDALQNVLESLTEFKTGRIFTVFGCGGDRDAAKRPKMAAIAEQFSDLCIVTSDNPRSEAPEKIGEEIVKGFKKKQYLIELDRRKAIEKAIELSRPEDMILIAGKGHETYQTFAHKTIEFDDRKVAAQICEQKLSS